jgi:hypothetical protein
MKDYAWRDAVHDDSEYIPNEINVISLCNTFYLIASRQATHIPIKNPLGRFS